MMLQALTKAMRIDLPVDRKTLEYFRDERNKSHNCWLKKEEKKRKNNNDNYNNVNPLLSKIVRIEFGGKLVTLLLSFYLPLYLFHEYLMNCWSRKTNKRCKRKSKSNNNRNHYHYKLH